MSEQNAQLNPAAADDPEPVPPTAKRKAVQADDPGSQALAQDVAVLSGQVGRMESALSALAYLA